MQKDRDLVWIPRTHRSYTVKMPGIDRPPVNTKGRKTGYLGEQRPCVKQVKGADQHARSLFDHVHTMRWEQGPPAH